MSEQRWREAARAYQNLSRIAPDIEEAKYGLRNALAKLRAEGDKELEQESPREALDLLAEALSIVRETLPGELRMAGELHSRIGLAYSRLAQTVEAEAHFSKAVEVQADDAVPGAALGADCRVLLRHPNEYWALDDEWRRLGGSAGNPPLSAAFEAARNALGDYLTDFYRLADEKPALDRLLVATPIALELGTKLVPEDAGDDWSLLTSQLPTMRNRVREKTGVRVPGVRVWLNETDWMSDCYRILLDEIPVVLGTVNPGKRYTPASPAALERIGIPAEAVEEAANPVNGEPGCWVAPDHWKRIEENGVELWADLLEFVTRNLEAVLLANLASFVGVQEVDNLIEEWGDSDSGGGTS